MRVILTLTARVEKYYVNPFSALVKACLLPRDVGCRVKTGP